MLGDIKDSTSLNRFSYVNGNPISLVDPFGLEGLLSIYAHEDHAWIGFYDYDTGTFTTHGVYGNRDTIYEPNRELKDVKKYPNLIYKGHASLTREITDDQQESIMQYIKEHKKWSYIYNCSDFAVGVWKAAGQGKLNIYGKYKINKLHTKLEDLPNSWKLKVDNPYTLMQSIKKEKGHKIGSLLTDEKPTSGKKYKLNK